MEKRDTTARRARVSLLDFGIIPAECDSTGVVEATLERAVLAEHLGFSRYWLAEHHSSSSAWASPGPLLGFLAAETQRIRIGSAGVLLAHYDPLAIANDYSLLANLAPGRLDLGLARGTAGLNTALFPPTDRSSRAYAERARTLISYFDVQASQKTDRAGVIPISPYRPTVWVLGTSSTSARLAAALGVSYCTSMFHHRAPSEPSVDAYVAKFRPSSVNTEPEFSIAIAGICADSRKEAKRLAQQHTNPWVGPNVVGTASDCAALFDRTVRMTGTSEIIFLDLAQDARARLATCHHLAEVCKLTTQA